jgi:hypothetical protein
VVQRFLAGLAIARLRRRRRGTASAVDVVFTERFLTDSFFFFAFFAIRHSPVCGVVI